MDMRFIFIGLLVSAVYFSPAMADVDLRNGINFSKMITEITGRNALDFNDYGNWCGLGGQGEPVDDLDRCCMNHDKCYDRYGLRTKCHTYENKGVYLVSYKWQTKDKKQVECLDEKLSCPINLCECDREAALCFAKSKYNTKNRH